MLHMCVSQLFFRNHSATSHETVVRFKTVPPSLVGMIAVIVRRRFDCVRARHVIVECFSWLQSEAFVEAQTEEDSDDDGSWQCRREHDRARRHLRKTGQLP